MRHLFWMTLLTIGCAAFVKAQERFTEVDLTVNGIRAGSTIQTVKNLGKPIKVKKIGFDECGDGYRRVLYFAGLEIGVLGNKATSRASVISLNITSTKWRIAPGLRIGATQQALLRAYGRPNSSDSSRLDYVTTDNLGLVTFHLRNGKLYRVEMMETLC